MRLIPTFSKFVAVELFPFYFSHVLLSAQSSDKALAGLLQQEHVVPMLPVMNISHCRVAEGLGFALH